MTEDTRHRTARYLTYTDDAVDADEQQRQAVATLRDGFRAVGMLLDEATVRPDEPVPVLIRPDGSHVHTSPGEANGFYVDWHAHGIPRISDADVPVVLVDAGGDVVVPEPVATDGGDLRVRHDYGTEDVTITATSPDGDATGYLFHSPVDASLVHVELLAGTAGLHVERDTGE